MNKIKSSAFALSIATALLSSYAQAATVVVDDANFGSGTVLRDTTNNLDYLRLDLTMGYGYNGVLAESGAGGVFEGWVVATESNMQSLGVSSGITGGSTDPAQIAIAESLRDWFCPAATCVNLSSSHEYARGLLSDAGPDFSDGEPSLLAFSIGRRFNVQPNEVDFRVSGFGSYRGTNEEIWLVRDSVSAVPVPAAAWLFGSGLIGLVGMSRRKKNQI